ncbi:MAG TPA: outer membrane protein assembly factor BamA [Verrucomicrobiae bacterium]|nr:outer membrane protein assembly factor BamA [Verrucomicrobiae bacterium]
MKSLFRLFGLLLFLSLSSAWAQTSVYKVSKIDIKHVGPAKASDELIRANIRVKVGDPYLPAAVDDDVRNLYATGQFYNIRVAVNPNTNGLELTYVLQGKPRLTEISFQGNTKYSDRKLRKKLTSKIGEPLDEQKLFTDCREIQKMYQTAGYPGTEVKYVLNIDANAGTGTATIEIKESQKIRIVDVVFVGAHAFSQKELRKVLKTRRHWMFSWITRSGVFKEDQFQDDKERLAEFYRSKGYIDFELKDVKFDYPTPRKMVIRLIIYEGRQYKVGSVKFTGNSTFSTAEIIQGMRALQPPGALGKQVKLGPNGLKMDVGDVFTPSGYEDDIQQIQDFYGSKGYIDVSRRLNVVRIPNTETGTMDLEFKIEEGQKSYIEKIEIRGNTKTKDRVIRRELAVAPGDVYDMVRVNRSKRRLENMQYFENVNTRAEPTDVPNRKDLVISVDEKNTGNMMVGAGFSSVDSLVGYAELTQGNFDLFNPPRFTGGGQKFRLRVQLGTERQDYLASFVEPWFLGKKLQLSVDLYHRELDFNSLENLYDERRTGMRIGLTRALGSDFLIGSMGYRIEDVGIDFNGNLGRTNGLPIARPYIPKTLLKEDGDSWISKFDFSLAYDTRNSTELSDSGQRTELMAEIAGPFGGEKDYYKIDLHTHWYFKGLAKGHVLELMAGTGTTASYGSTDDVPFYDRYYLGGLYSMRGFKYRGVSPRDPRDANGFQSHEPVGGDSYWFGSAEYSIPIVQRLRFAVFYDIGNVSAGPYTYNFKNFNDNWGLGLRLNLPIGPLRLDYGVPIHHDRFNGSSGQFQFGVGFERPF